MSKFFCKVFDAVSDVAVAVGSAVGVGLISGKETQIFVGGAPNAVIFAVVFCVIMSVFREFCRKNNVTTANGLAIACFGKLASPFSYVLSLCSFVCAVACLAGVEQCLSDILYLSPLPLYAIVTAALAALVMLKGMSALKTCNVVSLVMAAGLFVALSVGNSGGSALSAVPRPYMPVIYALFTFTMSLAVTCKLGASSSKQSNILRSAVSAFVVAALLVFTVTVSDFAKPLPTLSGITNPYLKVYATVTVALCSMCGIVGCGLPVCELVDGVIGDRTLTSALVFGCACAFSMFGFDFLVRFGYLFVALIGGIVMFSVAKATRTSKNRLYPARTPPYT